MPSNKPNLTDSEPIATTIRPVKSLWKRFQIEAILADLTLQEAVTEALADWVAKRERLKKKKAPTP